MIPIKFDYIFLEDFFKIHHELTNEEKAQILALDTNFGRQPIIVDRDTGFKSNFRNSDVEDYHVLEASEVQNFFHSYFTHENWNFTRGSYEGHRVNGTWQEKLVSYLIKNIDDRVLQQSVPQNLLPIPEGKRLLSPEETPPANQSVAEYNFSLYLEWFEIQLKDAEGIDDLISRLSVGPFRVLKAHVLKNGEFHKEAIAFNIVDAPLFWQLLDPNETDPELKVRFQTAYREAEMTTAKQQGYNVRYLFYANVTQDQYSFALANAKTHRKSYVSYKGMVIDYENFSDLFLPTFKKMFFQKPLYEDAKGVKTNLPQELFLDENKKAELHTFLSNPNFDVTDLLRERYFGAEAPYVPKDVFQKSFLKIFGMDRPEYKILDGVIYKNARPYITVDDLLVLNGYKFKIVDGAWQAFYVKSFAVQPNSGSSFENQPSELLFEPIQYPLGLVPLSLVPLEVNLAEDTVSDIMLLPVESFVKKYLNVFPIGNLNETPIGLAQIEFYLEQGAWERLLEDFEYVSSVFTQVEKSEGVVALTQFYNDLALLRSYDFDTYDQKNLDMDPFHFQGLYPDELVVALQNNPNPKLCLAILLINSEFNENLQNSLPYLFAQLDWFVAEDVDNQVINNELVVGGSNHTIGNAWHKWKQSDYLELGKKIASIPTQDLHEDLAKIETPSLHYTRSAYKYFSSRQLDIQYEVQFPIAGQDTISVPKQRSTLLELSELCENATLDITKSVLSELQSRPGEVELKDILYASYEPAVREDIRRILKKVLDRHEVYYIFKDSNLQFELLPEFVFINYLKTILEKDKFSEDEVRVSGASYIIIPQEAGNAWKAFFKKNPVRASRVFERFYLKYTLNPDLKMVCLKAGFDNYLANPDKRVDFFLGLHEKSLMTVFYDFNSIWLLQSRIHKEEQLEVLAQSFANEDLQDKPTETQKISYLMEALLNLSDHGVQITKQNLQRLFQGHIAPEILDLMAYVFGEENQDLPILGLESFEKLAKTNPKLLYKHFFLSELLESTIRRNHLTEDTFAAVEKVFISFFEARCMRVETYDLTFKRLLDFAKSQGITYSLQLELIDFAVKLYQGKQIQELDQEGFFYKSEYEKLLMRPEFAGVLQAVDDTLGPVDYLFYNMALQVGEFEFPLGSSEFSGLWSNLSFAMLAANDAQEYFYSPDDAYLSYRHLKWSSFANEAAQEYLRIVFQKIHDSSNNFHQNEILYRPEQQLPELLRVLNHYSLIQYPTTATMQDTSGIAFLDIQPTKDNIARSYFELTKVIDLLLAYQKLDLDFAKTSPQIDTVSPQRLDPENVGDPLYRYALFLVHAFYGSEQALDELQAFHEKDQEFSMSFSGMSEIYDLLFDSGKKVLQAQRPELFALEGEQGPTYDLESDAVMAMVELAHPSPFQQELQNLWLNPQEQGLYVQATEHATAVMGVLTEATSPKPTGEIYSLVMKVVGKNIYDDINLFLDEVIAAYKSGVDISVVTISLAMFGRLDLESVPRAVTRKISYLARKQIPVLFAAGNQGEKDQADLLGMQFNLMAAIDPRLIVVGSATHTRNISKSKANEEFPFLWDELWTVSDFSSAGTNHFRSDVLMLGENVTLIDQKGQSIKSSGTSFSTPSLARLIVKMKELNPNLSVEMIQAILKMTAQDLPDADAYKEGAGLVNVNASLYVAYAMNFSREPEDKTAKAAELGVSEQQTDLDQLTKWIRRQVWFTDTFRQSYGE